MLGFGDARHLWASGVLLVALTSMLMALPAGMAPQAQAAGAGSIVYARGGKIFVAGPGGKPARRIRSDGTARSPYEHPTQSDRGTIAALRGAYLYRFSRRGRRLGKPRKIARGVAGSGPLHELAVAPELSPDGRHVAFYTYLLQGIYDPSTGISGMNVITVTLDWIVASSGRRIGEIDTGDHYANPSWIGNDRILYFAPFNHFAPEVFTTTIGGDRRDWFADEFNGEDFLTRQSLDDGELSAARDKLALVKGTNVRGDSANAVMQLYAVSSLDALPTPACSFRPPGTGPFSGPSWSPDGSSIAWSNETGVWTSRVNLAASGCGAAPRRIARGGREPDWGRASVR